MYLHRDTYFDYWHLVIEISLQIKLKGILFARYLRKAQADFRLRSKMWISLRKRNMCL